MQPGDVLDDKYLIEAQLGAGGMGSVYGARHRVLDSRVAIKVLHASAAANPASVNRFLREARAAARLRGDHVCRVIDVGREADDAPYMVMELLDGADLASTVARGALAVDVAVDYIIQACAGLAEAHALGLVHRDVKPANLFATTRSRGGALIKVLDFGIATAAERDPGLTSTSALLGSPMYMSPEQLRSAKSVDARSDVWSLGVTLYELVSGLRPFTGQTFIDLSVAIATEPHPRLFGDAAKLLPIIDRCLAKDPRRRFGDAAELGRALSRFTGARSTTTAELFGEIAPRPRARASWMWIGSGLAAAATVAVIAVVAHHGEPRARAAIELAPPPMPTTAAPTPAPTPAPPVIAPAAVVPPPPPVSTPVPSSPPRPPGSLFRPHATHSLASPPITPTTPRPSVFSPPPTCKPTELSCGL